MYSETAGQVESASAATATSLWADFSHASEEGQYLRNWLALQCSLIEGARQALLVMAGAAEQFSPVAAWPDAGSGRELAEVTERALEERCGLVIEQDAGEGTAPRRYAAAYPILVDDHLHGAVAVEVVAPSEAALEAAMGQLQWGVSWLEVLVRRRAAAEEAAALERLRTGVDLLAATLAEPQFAAAAMAFVTELATGLGCERVSLGFVRRGHARVEALSHTADFGQRMNLIRSLGATMDEAIDQGREIVFPPLEDGPLLITRCHEQLAKQHGAGAILTVPLYGDGRYYGAVTLERPDEFPFDADEVDLCRSVAALAGPALEEKRLNDRLLVRKAFDSLRDQLARLFGPRYLVRKLVAVAALAVAVFFTFATGEYRVSADTALQGAVRRVLVAPFNGYVTEADARAGDVVEKGQLLARLDDRDLRIERLKYVSQRAQLQRQVQEAMAAYDRAKVKILSAQIDQVNAQLELVESQLARTNIKAPFRGVVASGDLSQMLGGSVQQGEVLFEVAPLNAYRVILQVDEHDIDDIHVGQHGTLVLSSLPDEHLPFVVSKVTPVATAKDGANRFRVEAALEHVSPRLRPGMEGVGKIDVGERKLISIWTHGLRQWLRLKLWQWQL